MTYELNHIDPDEIDRLRFKAFKTNDPHDTLTYYKAASSYFQDRHVREMNRADLAIPLDDPRVKALVEAGKAVVDRWDSPLWKDLPHTGESIADLRAALSALEENK